MTPSGNTSTEYFDRMYQVPDPWGYETSPYEQRKYAITVAALPRSRYTRIFEPGCSIGVLSELLAERGDQLLATDLHRPSLERARHRLRDRAGVTIEELTVPDTWPDGSFDLVVLSEVAYYLDDAHLALLADRVASSLDPGGDVVLVHWRGETDYPQTGDGVHERWRADRRFSVFASYREADFCLDVLRRRAHHDAADDPAGDTPPAPSRPTERDP